MSIPDNDVRKLYQEIADLKQIVIEYQDRLLKAEKALATVITNQKADYKLLTDVANCISSLDKLFDVIKKFASIGF
jgi:hypothetical protein